MKIQHIKWNLRRFETLVKKENIIKFSNSAELAIGFASIFSNKVISLLNEKTEINIALSGGNTPLELFNILAADYNAKIEWNNINFYWVDERCVPADSPESNFGNAYNTLFKFINVSPARLHRIKGEYDPEKEAERYSELVSHNIPAINSLPSFDIILLGIGDDGHTASIFPNQMELITVDKIYAVALHPDTGQKRITMTGSLINNAKYIYFLVRGKNKENVVKNILDGNEEANKYPANYIKPVNGEMIWIVS